MVNIFLSSFVWSQPRPGSGIRHHVLDLYSRVFSNEGYVVYPTRPVSFDILGALWHLTKFKSGTFNVVTQGYPVIAAFLALLLGMRVRLIVHTWKVPGHTDDRLTARLYDLALDRLIRSADLVVVASEQQRRQLSEKYPKIRICFAPVTVDCEYWSPDRDAEGDPAVLSNFGLKRERYVLTVGGNDRDERFGILLARELGLKYVRATNDRQLVGQVAAIRDELGAADVAKVLLNVSDGELRVLYRNAYIVCLPTFTRTNPAGLSALVEAMACGAVVAVPASIAEGYIEDAINGFVLSEHPKDFSYRLTGLQSQFSSVRRRARQTAVKELAQETIAEHVRGQLGTPI